MVPGGGRTTKSNIKKLNSSIGGKSSKRKGTSSLTKREKGKLIIRSNGGKTLKFLGL